MDATSRAEHFGLCFYAAVVHLIEKVAATFGSLDAAFERFPFLVGYDEQLAEHGIERVAAGDATRRWRAHLRAWEQATEEHLPLRALREAAALDQPELTMLLTAGLVEEDARFGLLFEALQATPGLRLPTMGLLASWDPDARAILKRLGALGLVQVVNPQAPRCEWAVQVAPLVWDAARGETIDGLAGWLQQRDVSTLPELGDLIVPPATRAQLDVILALLRSGEAGAVIIRGSQHNGRRTVLGAIARASGRGLLEVGRLDRADDERWKVVGPLAALLDAMPAVVLDLGPGETAELPELPGCDGPIAVVLGNQGGVAGPRLAQAVTLCLDMPDPGQRSRHWAAGLGDGGGHEVAAISERYRMTSGNIRRGAGLARSYAALDRRQRVSLADVREASRALNRQTLDTLAARVETSGDWSQLAVAPQTLGELQRLEGRCRHRERLQATVGKTLAEQLNVGVRALFSGPSGTGKTLAARVLASVLELDLYRLDLSSIVNKYLGETEKSLDRVLARAEELNVILLLDEGDALLTQRTSVQTSNDRYANLETNFLLQRLESFEGILIVTTNAGNRIDGAFRRRMDVVIDFAPPDALERFAIWQLHLPATHAVEPAMLREIAGKCVLTGGQIRNAVLHASVLALEHGTGLSPSHLEEAVVREYRKAGAICPLRQTAGAGQG